MRLLLLFLLVPVAAKGEALSAKDQADIRIAIEEQAKQENQKPAKEIWSERGPVIYKVRTIEPVAANVATAEADGARTGTFPERGRYLFILTRTDGHWTVIKTIHVCDTPGFKLIGELRKSAEHGSSGCPG